MYWPNTSGLSKNAVIDQLAKCERECRSLSGLRVNSNLAPVTFGDTPTEGQPGPNPGMFILTMETLKHLEDATLLIGIDANTFVVN